MTNEEKKQSLIEDCKREISHFKRCIDVYPDAPVIKSDLMRQEIALAALTAKPVKKPKTHDAHGFPEPAHIINSRWIESIREAGHEVQE